MNALGDRIRTVIVLVQSDEEGETQFTASSSLYASAASVGTVECALQRSRGYHVMCMLPAHTVDEKGLCNMTELVLRRVRDFYSELLVPVTFITLDELTFQLSKMAHKQRQASPSRGMRGAATGVNSMDGTLRQRCMERPVSVLQCKASQLSMLRTLLLPPSQEHSCNHAEFAKLPLLPACLFVELDLMHNEYMGHTSPSSPAVSVIDDVDATPLVVSDWTAKAAVRDVLNIDALDWLRPTCSSYVSETWQKEASASTNAVHCPPHSTGASSDGQKAGGWFAVPTHMYSNYPVIRDTGLCRAPRNVLPTVALQHNQCTLSAVLRECAFKAGALAKYGS